MKNVLMRAVYSVFICTILACTTENENSVNQACTIHYYFADHSSYVVCVDDINTESLVESCVDNGHAVSDSCGYNWDTYEYCDGVINQDSIRVYFADFPVGADAQLCESNFEFWFF